MRVILILESSGAAVQLTRIASGKVFQVSNSAKQIFIEHRSCAESNAQIRHWNSRASERERAHGLGFLPGFVSFHPPSPWPRGSFTCWRSSLSISVAPSPVNRCFFMALWSNLLIRAHSQLPSVFHRCELTPDRIVVSMQMEKPAPWSRCLICRSKCTPSSTDIPAWGCSTCRER